jgi:hypothetical protein
MNPLSTTALVCSFAVALAACAPSGGRASSTANPPPANALSTPPANAASAQPANAQPSNAQPSNASTRKAAAAKPAPGTVASSVPPPVPPTFSSCSPAPEAVTAPSGYEMMRVKDCKHNKTISLPASSKSLIDSYIAQCQAQCAAKPG